MSDKKKEANAKISEILAKIDALYNEATNIADEAGVGFYVSGPAYGMGGSYEPKNSEFAESDEWSESSEDGWYPSSQSC